MTVPELDELLLTPDELEELLLELAAGAPEDEEELLELEELELELGAGGVPPSLELLHPGSKNPLNNIGAKKSRSLVEESIIVAPYELL